MGGVYPVIWCPVSPTTGKVMERPGHCRHVTPFAVDQKHIELGAVTPSGGPGMLWADVPLEQIAGQWRETTAGWWVNMGDIRHPGQLARPRLMDGVIVRGAQNIPFIVPRLLQWHPEARLVSALPSVWKDYAWVPPEQFASLIDDLRKAVMTAPAPGLYPDPAIVRLAVRILGLNYAGLSEHEITFLGWLDTVVIPAIILNAAAFDQMEAMIAREEAKGRTQESKADDASGGG